VLIVGAGPAGGAAAVRLARAGRDVLLVDRYRFPRLKPCGEYYNPEAVRLLGELGVLPALLAAGGRWVRRLVLGTGGGAGLDVPFDQDWGPALSLGRETLDALLVEEARRAGARVWEGAIAREPLFGAAPTYQAFNTQRSTLNASVAGALIDRDARLLEVRAEITLAADGLRSRFARRLGLAGGEPRRRKFGIAARYAARAGVGDRIEMHAGPGGTLTCCGLVVRGPEANLGMVVDGRRVRELGGNPAGFFRNALESFPGLSTCLEGEPVTVRTAGPLTWSTRRQSAAGCLLLGDAAGFYDPFTGQGVTFALMTAALAAEVADASLEERDVSAARLAEYDRRRRALLGPRILVQQGVQAVIERPGLLRHVIGRLNARPGTARTLLGVIGDVLPPERAFAPGFLAGLVL
jgi:flavin-dependent dehydrogenase